MTDDQNDNDKTKNLWEEFCQNISPLKKGNEKIPPETRKEIYIQDHNLVNDQSRYQRQPNLKIRLPYLDEGDVIGIDKNKAKSIVSGKQSIDATLDLHGYNQDLAFDALYNFIIQSRSTGKRCILIITGKGKQGKGILFEQTPKWLNSNKIREHILFFSYSQKQHGGKGAIYVYLKKKS